MKIEYNWYEKKITIILSTVVFSVFFYPMIALIPFFFRLLKNYKDKKKKMKYYGCLIAFIGFTPLAQS